MHAVDQFRGPVALDQVVAVIGSSFSGIVVDPNSAVDSPASSILSRLGYTWECGCEARGNGNPFCLWRPCPTHAALAARLEPRVVPEAYEGGVTLPAEDVLPILPGDVVLSAAGEIARALKAGSPVGYVENGSLVREYPDGRREVLERF